MIEHESDRQGKQENHHSGDKHEVQYPEDRAPEYRILQHGRIVGQPVEADPCRHLNVVAKKAESEGLNGGKVGQGKNQNKRWNKNSIGEVLLIIEPF